MPKSRAFSVPELLISIGILALLIGLTLPVLADVRGRSTQIVSLSNARQLHSAIELFADQARDAYPVTEEGVLYPTTGGPGDPLASFGYWQVVDTWPGVLNSILPYRDATDVYVSPRSTRFAGDPVPWPTSYHLSTSVAGRSSLWNGAGLARPEYKQASRRHDVRFPSAKSLLWDSEAPWRRENQSQITDQDLNLTVPTAIVQTDGSGAFRVQSDAAQSVPNPFAHLRNQSRLHNTPDGVSGRDY